MFLRMLDNNKRGKGTTVAAAVTFMVSAIWHGFYPGFFAFFIGAFLMDYHNKIAEQKLGPYFKDFTESHVVIKSIKNASITIFYYVSCSYFTVAFWLLNLQDFHKVYKEIYYCGHILIIGTLVLMLLLPGGQRDRKVKTKWVIYRN